MTASQMQNMGALYGRHDRYQGKFQLPIIEVHEPAKLLEINRANSGVNIKLSENFGERIEHITARDDHRLTVLGADERAALAAMPEMITAYRGCYEINRYGLSWTTDMAVAAKFPTLNRYSRPGEQPLLLRAIACRDRAVVKLGREESEVIVVDAHEVAEVTDALA